MEDHKHDGKATGGTISLTNHEEILKKEKALAKK